MKQKRQLRGIVYIDGPDATGKTTLARYLVEHFGAEYFHGEARWFDKMHYYHLALLRKAVKAAESTLVVLDRHWMSEVIYASVYRNGPKFKHSARMFDRILMSANCVNVIAIPVSGNPDEVNERFNVIAKKRDELYKTDGRMRDVAQGYINLAHKSHHGLHYGMFGRPDTLVYDMEIWNGDPGGFCDLIADSLIKQIVHSDNRNLTAERSSISGCIWGATHLVLGSMPYPGNRVKWNWCDYKAANRYLHTVLDAAGVDETQLLWCPRSVDNSILEHLICDYQYPVIALDSLSLAIAARYTGELRQVHVPSVFELQEGAMEPHIIEAFAKHWKDAVNV